MKSKLYSLTIALTALCAPIAAHADVLTFETPDTNVFAAGLIGPYAGLNFTNFSTVDRNGYGPSGYANVVVSGDQSACGCAPDFGQTISSITSLSTFDLNSGYFAAAWNDGATLVVNGFLGGDHLFAQNFQIFTTGPQFLQFNFTGIDRAEFSVSGGTPSGLPGAGDYFAVDDLDISVNAVPEPATWGMMLLGFAAVGSAMRRRTKTRVSFA